MSDFMEIIQGRRSVRKYEETPVPDDALHYVLEAVRWSPSWANTQCWEIVVVTEREMKEKFQAVLSKGNPATKAVVAAPVVLVICGRKGASGYYNNEATTKFGDWFLFDLGIATQNLCLAAHEKGLGTVVVGLFDHARVGELLGVPENHDVVALIPMGYPAKISSAPKRREIDEFVHHETFA